MSGKEAMMEGMAAGRQDSRPKKADAPAVSGGEAQNDAVARRIRLADADIQSFSDALWLEDGLSKNTLQAYRRDLAQLARWLRPARPICWPIWPMPMGTASPVPPIGG